MFTCYGKHFCTLSVSKDPSPSEAEFLRVTSDYLDLGVLCPARLLFLSLSLSTLPGTGTVVQLKTASERVSV